MNILFIGLVKFEIKQWFSAYQDKFCAWFSLARLPTETARVFFLSPFCKKETALSFFSLPLVPVQRFDKTFRLPYRLPSHVKYYLNSQNFPPF